MLDRSKLIQELSRVSVNIFKDCSDEIHKASSLWQRASNDPELALKISSLETPSLLLPIWQQELINKSIPIQNKITEYSILSVDGSQIYPDRHQGPSCFLINIGSIAFIYADASCPTSSQAHLFSNPYVFSAYNQDNLHTSTDLVNCKRQELEFAEGLRQGLIWQKKKENNPFLLLFDGSLVCWLLESKDAKLQEYFLPKYIDLLEQMHQQQIPMAGYISLPKSRELVNILRLVEADFNQHNVQSQSLKHIFDTDIAHFFLRPYERTIVFQCRASMSMRYPTQIRPHFFYINVGSEIARIEVPGWIAGNDDLINQIAHIIVDQSNKGYGYPIAIAEAHETAVIKGPDRDFFYHLLDKISIDKKTNYDISQKSRRKKYIGI